MRTKQYGLLLFLFLITSVLGITYFKNFQLESNILSSLNQKIYNDEVTEAFSQYEDKLSSQVIIVLSGKTFNDNKRNAILLKSKLEKSTLFSKINLKRSNKENLEFSTFYYARKRKLLTENQMESIELENINSLEIKAIKKLYNPFSISTTTFQYDPYLLFDDFLDELKLDSQIKLRDGFFTVKNAIIVRASLKDQSSAKKALDLLRSIQKEKVYSKLLFSSLAFYEVKARKQSISESNIFSVLSILLILFLFYSFFKSFRHVLISLSVISLSAIVGIYITTLILGPIHIIALLLGISVLGVIADYFIHFFMEETDVKVRSAKDALTNIKRPMFYSFFTSAIGFSIFFFVPLDIINQFSLFSIITLALAVGMVFFVLPQFYIPSNIKQNIGINEKIQTKLANSKIVKCFTIILVVFSLYSLVNEKIENDVRSFSTRDKELFSQEKIIKDILGVNFSFEQFIVSADTEQKLIENEEELRKELRNISVDGSFISNWIPSLKTQKKSERLYMKLDLSVDSLLTKILVKNESDIKKNMLQNDMDYIYLDDLKNEDLSKQFVGRVGEKFYSIVPLFRKDFSYDLKKLNDHRRVYVNKVQSINLALDQISKNVMVGLLFVFILLFTVFNLKHGVVKSKNLLIPTFLSVVLSLTISSYILNGINIFQLLACVLILGLGLDYSFFYFFNRGKSKAVSKAVTLSTLTTLSSFGVLCFSETAAVASFGVVVIFGMIICWFLVPSVSIGDLSE